MAGEERERRGHTRHAHEERSGCVTGCTGGKRHEEYARRLVDGESIRYVLRGPVTVQSQGRQGSETREDSRDCRQKRNR